MTIIIRGMLCALFAMLSCRADLNLLIGNQVSSDLEQYVKNMAQDLGITQQIKVVQPSVYYKEIAPVVCYGYALMPYNIIFIDEDWFSVLSESEKRYTLGRCLLPLKDGKLLSNTYDRRWYSMRGALGICEAGMAYVTYNYVYKLGYSLSRNMRIGITLVQSLLFELCVEKPLITLYKKRKRNELTLRIIRELDCLDGALDLCKRWKKEIAPQADTFYWKEFYTEVCRLIPWLEKVKQQHALTSSTI